MAIDKLIASHLLDIEAVKLRPNDPFQWASGWNSPIYCDNRMTLSYPAIRTVITEELVKGIKEHYPEVEAIAGVATAGIPQGALIAEALNIPFIYVRSKPKAHGMTNCIEGRIVPGQKVVVIEDLISTGGSSLKAVDDLRAVDITPIGMGAIFTYGFDLAAQNFKNSPLTYFTLSNYDVLIDVALEKGIIKEEALASLAEWRQDPANWKK